CGAARWAQDGPGATGGIAAAGVHLSRLAAAWTYRRAHQVSRTAAERRAWLGAMSGPRRTPIARRSTQPQFTPRAIELFEGMEKARRARRRSNCNVEPLNRGLEAHIGFWNFNTNSSTDLVGGGC